MSLPDTPTPLLQRMTQAAAGLLLGGALAYVAAFDLPHLELRALEAREAALVAEVETLEPGLTITQGRYRFDPGLDPAIYGTDAFDLCGSEGSLYQLPMFYGGGLLQQGYDHCAEMLLARMAYRTGSRPLRLSEVFIAQGAEVKR